MAILMKIFDILSGAAGLVKVNVPIGSAPQQQPGIPRDPRPAVAIERGGVTPAPAPAPAPVNVDLILEKLGEQTGATDWRHSIVDLMKCFGYDASFENRVELAKDLGYTGEMDVEHSAEMNMWLHKELMAKLVEQGGQLKL